MSNKKIVITRPLAQGKVFADKINASCLFLPLLEIHDLPVTLPNLNLYNGVITTSLHAQCKVPQSSPSYHIGEDAFTACDLAHKITQDHQHHPARFLYLRGRDIVFDMKSTLESQGHRVDEIISYEALAVTKLNTLFLQALHNKEIAAISFFSNRTAQIFLECAKNSGVLNQLNGLKALCISESVLNCETSIFGKNIAVSDSPDLNGMVRLVQRLYEE